MLKVYCEKDKNKQKESGFGPYFFKKLKSIICP